MNDHHKVIVLATQQNIWRETLSRRIHRPCLFGDQPSAIEKEEAKHGFDIVVIVVVTRLQVHIRVSLHRQDTI